MPLLLFQPPPSAQTLTPSLFTNTNTFYAPTVVLGAIADLAVLPSLFLNINTFFAPRLHRSYVPQISNETWQAITTDSHLETWSAISPTTKIWTTIVPTTEAGQGDFDMQDFDEDDFDKGWDVEL